MTAIITPEHRIAVPSERILTAETVSQLEWSSMGSLVNWLQSRGAQVLSTMHCGLTVPQEPSSVTLLDTSFATDSSNWFRPANIGYVILLGIRVPFADSSDALKLTVTDANRASVHLERSFSLPLFVPGGAAVSELVSPLFLRESDLWYDKDSRGEEMLLTLTAQTIRAHNPVVESITVMELPKGKLELDFADYGVDAASLGSNTPIADFEFQSVRGAVDAYLYSDHRRSCYFFRSGRDNPITFTGATAETHLYPLGIPVYAPIEEPGDLWRDDNIIIRFDARLDNDGTEQNTASVTVSSAIGSSTGDTHSVNISGNTWTTYTVNPGDLRIACEDLSSTSTDGRRQVFGFGAWELIKISAKVENPDKGATTPVLRIGNIGIFSPNAWGESGFTATDFYESADGTTLDGGAESILVHALFVYGGYNNSNQFLAAKWAGNTGYVLYTGASNRAIFQYRNGTTNNGVSSAVDSLEVGKTYMATGQWDGTTQRITLNEVDVTSGGIGSMVPASSTEFGIGARADGNGPSTLNTILGVSGTGDSDSMMTLSEIQAYHQLCLQSGDIRPFAGVQHMWSARYGLHCDLVGDAHLTLNGSTTRQRLIPYVG